MRVRGKLTAAFLAVSSLVVLTGAVSWREAREAAERASVAEAVHISTAIGLDLSNDGLLTAPGVAPAPLSGLELQAYVTRMHDVQQRDLVVLDATQHVVADAIPDNVGTLFDHDEHDEIGEVLRTGRPTTFVETSEDYPAGIAQVAVAVRAGDGQVAGAIVLEYTPMLREMVALNGDLRHTIVATVALCLLAALVLALLVSASLTRRLRRLTEGVRHIADGDYSRRVPARDRGDEVEELARAFNGTAARLEESSRLVLAKEFTDSILAGAGEGICGTDAAGAVTFANAAAARILGVPVEQLVGRRLDVVLPGALRSDARAAVSGGPTVRELELARPDGSCAAVEYTLTPISPAGGRGGVLVVRDVTEQRALERDLRHQALHDALTGLVNRTLFQERLAHAMVQARHGARSPSVLFLDLDGFKRVNDTLGHDAGDDLLRAAAARLLECLRPQDTLARFGGDEFGVLLDDADRDAAAAVAERLLQALRRPFRVAGRDVQVGASTGMLVDAGRYGCAEEVVRNADVAMYAAKADGKGRAREFQAAMHTELLERMDLEQRLRGAVRRGEMTVHYQPVVDLASGRLSGVEALVRWQDPERGLQPPGVFVPLAEETGLVVEIDRFVLGQACRTVRALQRAHPDQPLSLSVNLSAAHLEVPDLAERVADVLRSTGLAPGSLVLEITETVLMSNLQVAVQRLQQVRDLGVRIAIDDFGTGYSSLGQLRDVPADLVKIDQSFVRALSGGPRDLELVQAIVALGHTLGLQVVAEGIEDAEQERQVRATGCDAAQGYHLGRPQPVEQLRELLARDVVGAARGAGGAVPSQA